jgi:hypothetical protein
VRTHRGYRDCDTNLLVQPPWNSNGYHRTPFRSLDPPFTKFLSRFLKTRTTVSIPLRLLNLAHEVPQSFGWVWSSSSRKVRRPQLSHCCHSSYCAFSQLELNPGDVCTSVTEVTSFETSTIRLNSRHALAQSYAVPSNENENRLRNLQFSLNTQVSPTLIMCYEHLSLPSSHRI